MSESNVGTLLALLYLALLLALLAWLAALFVEAI